ncbi:MAG: SUMF1/EgtB/PvdO family nonheme iron enzyme [Cyanobacteriota bacterium]|nr:SUMF1/EgtB/PvdO family nonheme iron enzyme [Cyanobacteriota bacterium]
MGAIFISYTGRDPEGDAWADRLVAWCQEWNYGCFRDRDHSCGIKAGDDWRAELYQQLRLAQVLVCLVSRSYESSAWCVGEVAIAVERGKTVIPIHLLDTEAELKTKPLPLLLQDRQAILVARAVDPSAEQLAQVKERLRQSLDTMLNWRQLQPWDASQAPYPGLPAFEAHQAPVFFGRDKAIEKVVERLAGLALRPEAFLLLLGASGYGKSSLVRAGVVPRLKGEGDKAWTVLPPFTPGDEPFKELEEAVEEAGGVFHSSDPLKSLKELRRKTKAPVVLVIDQFEELLTAGPKTEKEEDPGEVFQRFLLQLLRVRKAGLMVLATMRTDYLAPLQTRWPALTGMASTYTLEPIEPENFGALITGPADRSSLTLEPGLEARLVNESGGRDALPLLAFTLEKLWNAKEGQMLTLKAYADLGGVEGAVSTRAAECWNPQTSTHEVRQALRQAFLEHLVSVGSDGRQAKRPAPLAELPIESREIVQRLVDDRLLVQKDGIVEIAHEALLRTWEPLVKWIEEDKEQLLQCLRVKRLSDDLKPEAPERQRRQALEQLAAMAAMAAAGGSEARAVQKEGTTPLSELLKADTCPPADREDAALVLALIGAEEPLRVCLANEKAPVALRRRAAESLGLLAKRSGDREQRQRIAAELEGWLRSKALDVRVEVELDPSTLDPAMVQGLVEQAQREVEGLLRQALKAGQLPDGIGDQQLQELGQALMKDRLGKRFRELQQQLWASGQAAGWKEHDEQLPLLQGASRGLQLAVSADLPLFGSGPGRVVPMLTLTALDEGNGLRIRTEVVEVPVWQLPLPGGERLELVMVPAGTYRIGSPAGEDGRTAYTQFRSKCDPREVDVEAERMVPLQQFAMVRHPISQGQWRALVEATPDEKRPNVKPGPGTFRDDDLWERDGQPGGLPVDSVSWNLCGEWIQALNGWIEEQWPSWAEHHPAIGAVAVQFALPSESQWEAACRARAEPATPFHFGDTIDPAWARYDASYIYGKGRRGEYERRPVPIGFFGLVNRHGLAELHGQLSEWCGDQWHRDPVSGAPADGGAMEGPDPGLTGDKEQRYRLLRGGAWFDVPRNCRAANRVGNPPAGVSAYVGVRLCCPLPPGSLLGP